MVRTKDGDGGIKSNSIVSEVQKRPCLYDTNHSSYGDRAEKARSWEEVCASVVPGWCTLALMDKFAAGKEVQKRWRSIRDSYTKAFRQGKCLPAEQCPPGSRRSQYHRQMAFLLRALQNKKPRYSQDKYDSFSEISNSPQHPPPDDIMPKIKNEILDKPLDLKTKPETPDRIERPEMVDKANQVDIETEEKPVEHKNPSVDIKLDNNGILPDDHFDDDKLFMNSLLPSFKKMDDDTRLLCRIEVLKIVRYALQGHKCFEALRMAEDSFFKTRISGILAKEEFIECTKSNNESTLSMTTRSADGSRPVRKRKIRTPSPLPTPPKRRGPGRPRKVRPPPSDSEDDLPCRRRCNKLRPLPPDAPQPCEMDDTLSRATSVAQLSTPLFMKMYNLERSKLAPTAQSVPPTVQLQSVPSTTFPASVLTVPPSVTVSIKSEPVDVPEMQP